MFCVVDYFMAGDTVATIAREYEVEPEDVEACLRWAIRHRKRG